MSIWTEEEAKRNLLPPEAQGLAVVLFISCAEREAEAIEKFEHAVATSRFLSGVVELEGKNEAIASWFRLDPEQPTLAVIFDGMVLAIERECSEGSCQRAIRDALDQYRLFCGMERVS